MSPGLFSRRLPGFGARLGERLDTLSHAEFVALPDGARSVYREGCYEEDFYKHGGVWFWGEEGKRAPVSTLLLSRLTVIPAGRTIAARPPDPPPPESGRDRARREALERIAGGASGASESEVSTARRALGRP